MRANSYSLASTRCSSAPAPICESITCPACVCDAQYGSTRRRFGVSRSMAARRYMADIQGQQMQGAPVQTHPFVLGLSSPAYRASSAKLTEIDATTAK